MDSVRPYGHDLALAILESRLPAATLLLGPRGIGKTAVVHWLALHHGIHEIDRFCPTASTSMDTVRSAQTFLLTPATVSARLVTLDVDGASPNVQNALLKMVEEPPPRTSIVLRSTALPLPTLASRCVRIDLAPLSDDLLVRILAAEGYDSGLAADIAPAAHGSLHSARALLDSHHLRHQVNSIVTALTTGPDDSLYEIIPIDMPNLSAVYALLLDAASFYVRGAAHPLLAAPYLPTPPSRQQARILHTLLTAHTPSRPALRNAVWHARDARA